MTDENQHGDELNQYLHRQLLFELREGTFDWAPKALEESLEAFLLSPTTRNRRALRRVWLSQTQEKWRRLFHTLDEQRKEGKAYPET
jgi:hypothetical protein